MRLMNHSGRVRWGKEVLLAYTGKWLWTHREKNRRIIINSMIERNETGGESWGFHNRIRNRGAQKNE